jgi:putative ABC transport system permease protein
MRQLLRRLWQLLRQRRARVDLDEELAFHLEMKRRALEAQGATPGDATVAARRALGNSALAYDQVRDVWMPVWLQGLGQDFRVAWRTLRGTPIVSAVALLSLALGIGANATIFSLIDGLLLRPLPVREPAQLVVLTDSTPFANPYWDYRIWREIEGRPQLFAGMIAWADVRFNLTLGGETSYANGLSVSGAFFDVLGVPAVLGRTLSVADVGSGGGRDGRVAVISYDFWRHHFNGASDVIGRTLSLDGTPVTIVGVAPRGFFGVEVGQSFDVAVPMQGEPLVSIMARLRSDQTLDSSIAALRGVQPQIRNATLPQGWPKSFLDRYLKSAFTLEPASTGLSLLRRRFARPLLVVMAVVALVLLVACTNLANLALMRAAARRRELGVRLSLGASRWRLVRQALAESFVLASAGGVGGLVMESWSARLLVRQLFTSVAYSGPHAISGDVFLDLPIDGHVLAFTLALTLGTTVLFGLLPALRAGQVSPLDAIVEHRVAIKHRRGASLADFLVVTQVAISLVVVVAAGLFGRTLAALETRQLGFDREGVLIATLDSQHASVTPARRQALYSDVLDAVRGLPGVKDAAISSLPPVLSGPPLGQPISAISGEGPLPPRGAFSGLNVISPGWFQTLGIRLVAGRDVTPDDRPERPPVVLVNQTFVRAYVHTGDPLGRMLTLVLPGPPGAPVRIVGVVSDSVYGGLRDRIEPTIFLPMEQLGSVWWPALSSVSLSIRSSLPHPEPLTRSVAAAIGAVQGDLPLTFHCLNDYVNDSLVQERLVALLSESFAVVALLLAALGLYGVTAYAIARRRTEIAIRIALGAAPARIVALIVGRVLLLLAAGTAVGGAVSLWVSRFIAALLYDLQPRDPVTVAGAALVLVAVALLSSWLPARRAARLDPMAVVRAN